ncbi:hypothetical protein BB934_38230 (plasmid) [Microvirga ossetica]|uniref:ADP-ribosylglycohydrolase n=1 Tax=Microvirga ossetica TaxID=1882682 RepID=A0A1B2EVW0_9HYPH|nr:ADP-ribosylglycohydrolase family protein [Microvirga ossetica]ANY84096.1 hypothetical protein BB934_38230 [Microvirga ossetica]
MLTKVELHKEQLVERATAAMAYGRLGDSMGTPTENLEPDEITAKFGWVTTYEGDGTDDTIMALMIAKALIRTDGFATSDDWAKECLDHRELIFGDKIEKFFASVIHALTKVERGSLPRRVAIGNMPSSSSAMAIVPVGIVNAGNPQMAAQQASEIASFLHVDEVAFCQDGAAAMASAIAAALGGASTIEEVVETSTVYLKPWSGSEMIRLIKDACALAQAASSFEDFRSRYHASFRQQISCDSRETVPAALALSLFAEGDPEQAIIFGANFGRDTDTIACMAGYICGAWRGLTPPDLSKIAINDHVIEESRKLAHALVDVGQRKARLEVSNWASLAQA